MSTFREHAHPRHDDGKFAVKARTEVEVDLGTAWVEPGVMLPEGVADALEKVEDLRWLADQRRREASTLSEYPGTGDLVAEALADAERAERDLAVAEADLRRAREGASTAAREGLTRLQRALAPQQLWAAGEANRKAYRDDVRRMARRYGGVTGEPTPWDYDGPNSI